MSEVSKEDITRLHTKIDTLTDEFSRVRQDLAVLSSGIARDMAATERRITAIETAAGVLSNDVRFLEDYRKAQLAKLAGAGMVIAFVASVLTAIGMPIANLFFTTR